LKSLIIHGGGHLSSIIINHFINTKLYYKRKEKLFGPRSLVFPRSKNLSGAFSLEVGGVNA
jgi:hypothetical protein